MAILETYYKENMSKEDAMNICVAAIEAGIYHDLGSGSNVDVAVITKSKVEMFRNLKHDNHKVFSKPDGYQFKKERVQVIEEFRHKVIIEQGDMPMDLS
jgi:20S proteasome subunit beta 2